MDGKLTSTKSRGENKAKVRQLQNKIQKGVQANRPSKFEKKSLRTTVVTGNTKVIQS